jgi:hypothetical protein
MNLSDKTKDLKRIVKILATVEAFPGRRAEVLARLRVDEAAFLRDEQAFGVAFASLSPKERAQLTDLHRIQTAAVKREGASIHDLSELEPETRRETPREMRPAKMPIVMTEAIDSVRVDTPVVPFAGQTTPERLAVIRAAHPEDETTAGGDDDTLLTPRPELRPATPWDSAPTGAAEGADTEATVRAKRPRRGSE